VLNADYTARDDSSGAQPKSTNELALEAELKPLRHKAVMSPSYKET
jgi:hypothetical protein